MSTINRDPYQALKLRAYQYYSLGMFLTVIGRQIQTIALQWEIYEQTRQALYLGWVGFIQFIGMLALILPAGNFADRYSRKTVITIGLMGATITSLLLAWVSRYHFDVQLMLGIVFLDACFLTISRPARAALLPLTVPKEALANAVTWNSSLLQIALVAGPALGGLVLTQSVHAAYLINAGCTAIYVLLISMIKVEQVLVKSKDTALTLIVEGFQFIWSRPVILGAITLDMFAVLFGGAVFLLPIYAKEILHVGPTGYGWLMSAPAFGALVTAIAMAHLPPLRHAGRTLFLAVAGFGIVTIVFGFSEIYVLSFAMLFMTGVFDNISVVIRHTMVQMHTPDDKRGRVSAINSIFISSSNELGGAESGFVAQLFGPVFSAVSGGIGTLLVTGTVAWRCEPLRKLKSLSDGGENKST